MIRPMTFAASIAVSIALLTTHPVLAETPVGQGTFKCKDGKSIAATFYADKVDLKLSDGRSMTVPQAMSASGARYANADESFVFWNKGDTAFVTEGGGTETYSGCADAK